MYKPKPEQRSLVLNMLVEGSGMRPITRVTDVSRNAIARLLTEAGEASREFHNLAVKGVKPRRIECDELWSFIHCKRKNVKTAKAPPSEAGDVWLFKAMDADTKLLISYLLCPNRGLQYTRPFMEDLRARTSLPHAPEIDTDGLHTFELGARRAFGGDMSFAQIVKPQKGSYRLGNPDDDLFLKPAGDVQEKRAILGSPDLETATTSHLESFNQTTRAALRRFTRRTSGHSKSIEYHAHNLALYFLYYNWIRPHSTLGTLTTPAMAAGLAGKPFTFDGLLKFMDSLAPTPQPRGPYKPRKPKGPTQLEQMQLKAT